MGFFCQTEPPASWFFGYRPGWPNQRGAQAWVPQENRLRKLLG